MIFTGRKNAILRSRSRSLRVTRMEQERTEETEKSAESIGVGAGQDQLGNAVLETPSWKRCPGNAARQFQNIKVDDQPQRNIEEFHVT